MLTLEAKQAARLAALESAVLALLRSYEDSGVDGVHVIAEADDGQVSIDLSFTVGGQPLFGESL